MSENIDAEFDKDECKNLLNKVEGYVKSVGTSQIGNRRNWITYIKKYVSIKKHLNQVKKCQYICII